MSNKRPRRRISDVRVELLRIGEQKKGLTAADHCAAIGRYMTAKLEVNPQLTMKETAGEIGMSEGYLSRLWRLYSLLKSQGALEILAHWRHAKKPLSVYYVERLARPNFNQEKDLVARYLTLAAKKEELKVKTKPMWIVQHEPDSETWDVSHLHQRGVSIECSLESTARRVASVLNSYNCTVRRD